MKLECDLGHHFFIFLFYRNKNENKIHSGHFPIELKSKEARNGVTVTEGNLINLAAVEKTKQKNIIELQYCTGNIKIKLKKKKSFFFQFSKNRVGRVGKTKNIKPLALGQFMEHIPKTLFK